MIERRLTTIDKAQYDVRREPLRFSPVEKPKAQPVTEVSIVKLPGIRGSIGQLLETPIVAATSMQAARDVFIGMHRLVQVDPTSQEKITDDMNGSRRRILRDLFSQRKDSEAKVRRENAAKSATHLIVTAAELHRVMPNL